MSKNVFKSIVLLITFAGIVVLLLTRLEFIANVFKDIFAVLTPFLVGFIIAYVLNIPYIFFMNRAFKFMDKPPEARNGRIDEFFAKLRKPLSLIMSYAILFAVVIFLLSIMVPQITNSIQGVVDNFGVYYTSFQGWVFKIAAKFGFEYEFMSDIFADINSFIAQYTVGLGENSVIGQDTIFSGVTDYLFPHIFDFTKNLYNVVYNSLLSVIVSIYYLANKETLMNQIKNLFV